jgi:hypothetical protein
MNKANHGLQPKATIRDIHLQRPSLLPQHQIHHPAAADVRSRPAAMAPDVRVATARFRKGVGQFRQPLEGRAIVDDLGDD